MLTRIDHVGIACRDLEESVARYCSGFGLTVMSRETNEEQGVREAMLLVATAEPGGPAAPGAAAAPGSASYIQLLEPLSPDSPAALPEVAGTGVRLIDQRPRHGSLGASIAFLHPGDLGGVLTELVEPR